MSHFATELEAALEAAERASKVIMGHYASFAKMADAPADISTIADKQSQEIILDYLHGRFPTDGICAEETSHLGNVAATGPRLWIIDPIDGSRGFVKKLGEFSVMISFVDKGEVAVGVVGEPAKQRLTYAERGHGCWKRDGAGKPEPCRVSQVAELGKCALVQSHSKSPGMLKGPVQALNPTRIVETYSAGVKLAMVARGEVEIYLNTYEAFHDWDCAAGHVLVEEAGGRVTGMAGETLQYGLEGAWQRHGLLATNGKVHEAGLEALKKKG